MVLAKLTDSHNGNAIVAAAYIKLLIVGDAAAKPNRISLSLKMLLLVLIATILFTLGQLMTSL